MHRWIVAALVMSFAHLGCSADTTEPEKTEGEALSRTPFCLPGEKVVCTLGPPPVCHCEAEKPPVKTAAQL